MTQFPDSVLSDYRVAAVALGGAHTLVAFHKTVKVGQQTYQTNTLDKRMRSIRTCPYVTLRPGYLLTKSRRPVNGVCQC